MGQLKISEAKNILVFDSKVNSRDEEPRLLEAYTMALNALDIVESIPELKRAFPNSAVLDDILNTMREKGFDVPDFKIRGMY